MPGRVRARGRHACARRRRAIAIARCSRPSSPTSSSSSATRASIAPVPADCIRRPKPTFAATSRCGKSASSWNMRPMPRRCGGTPASDRPVELDRSLVELLEPGDRAQQRRLPASARAEHARRPLPVRNVEVDAGERSMPAERDPGVANREHQRTSPVRRRRAPRRAQRTTAIAASTTASDRRCSLVLLARPPEEAEDRDGERRLLGPGDEDRRSELAERDREGEARRRQRTHVRRAGDRSRAMRATAMRRASPATSRRRGSIERRAGVTIRITNGVATRAWATGTSHHDERKSSGGESNAITNPNPSITADAPSGSRTNPSRAPGGLRASATAARPPTTSAISGRDAGEDDRVAGRLPRLDEERGSLPEELAPASERPFDENGEREGERNGRDRQHRDERDALAPRRAPQHVVLVRPACQRRRPVPRGCSRRRARSRPPRAGGARARLRPAGRTAARRGCRSRSRASPAPGRRG